MTFLRNTWYVAGHAEDIAEKPCGRTILNEPIVLYRSESGKALALHGLCPHRFAPLDKGVVIGEAIRCPYHGLQFDGTGECVDMPLGDPAPPRACVRPYPLEERYGQLWIWMGEPEKANADLIPDFSYTEDQEKAWFRFTLHAKANYQLLVDNLLDLTHPEFLHPMLASKGWAKRTKYKVTKEGSSISIEGIAENDNISQLMKSLRPDLSDTGTSTQTERWFAPSLISLHVDYVTDQGNAPSSSAHFLTPETESTTHYFVVGDQAQDPTNDEMTQGMREGIKQVFQTEDLPIVEAQQRVIGDRDLLKMNPAILRSDQSAVMARKYIAKAIREEQKEA